MTTTGHGPSADALRMERERDEARDQLAKAGELIRSLERLMTGWTRGMYAARIDCWRGDPKAAAAILNEGLDGYDGTEWDGKETGEQWWERTKAEEGAAAQGGRGDEDNAVLADLLSLVGVTVTASDAGQWTAEQREAARDWAAREHLSASDNPVARMPKPRFLAEAEGWR